MIDMISLMLGGKFASGNVSDLRNVRTDSKFQLISHLVNFSCQVGFEGYSLFVKYNMNWAKLLDY